MATSALLTLLLSLPLLLPSRAPPPGDPDDFAKDAMKALSGAIKDRDVDAMAEAIDDLDGVYENVDAKTQGKILKSAAGVFDLKPKATSGQDAIDEQTELQDVYQLSIGLLYDKEGGPKLLVSALGKKHVKNWPDLQALFLEALSYGEDPKHVKLFLGYTEHEDPIVAAAAVTSLSRYREADDDLRYDIVESLIDSYWSAYKAAEKEARADKETELQDAYSIVEAACDRTLEKLTRRDFGGAVSWRGWWDDEGSQGDW